MKINVMGMVKKTSIPKDDKLLPMFECVVNSIQAIELKYGKENISNGAINISIIRGNELLNDINNKIDAFIIEDNGVGFTDKEMEAFNDWYTENKSDFGCHGIGRVLWLKAFNNVEIDSIYKNHGKYYSRKFLFNIKTAEDTIIPDTREMQDCDDNHCKTIIKLDKWNKKYQESYKLQTIAYKLLTHLLEYYNGGNMPPIILHDKDNEHINLTTLYEDNCKCDSIEEFVIMDHKFVINHLHIDKSLKSKHTMALFAHNRLVGKEINLDQKINGLFDFPINNQEKEVMYMCSVTSEYINENVNSIRTQIDIDDKNKDLFYESEISMPDIENAVLVKIDSYLQPYLLDNRTKSEDRINRFIEDNPKYKPIREDIKKRRIVVKNNISDIDLEKEIYPIYNDMHISLKRLNQKELKKQFGENVDQYQQRLQKLFEPIEKICQSDLISYVCRRKIVLEMLEQYMNIKDDDKFEKEQAIHNLIMPQKTDSTDNSFTELNNLWIIDEKLSFHQYIFSDKSFKQIKEKIDCVAHDGTERPDILTIPTIRELFTERKITPFDSMVIVEIKRPRREDKDNRPIEQTFKYIEKLKSGQEIYRGRPININEDNLRLYVYIIADFTDVIKQQCKFFGFQKSADQTYYFKQHENLNAYIEVIDFDGLLQNAQQRNRAFFDKIKYL